MKNLSAFDVAAAAILFAAIAMVACGWFVFYVRPWVAYRRDRHLTPEDGEIWRSAISGERFRVRARAESLALYYGGITLFLFAVGDGVWRRFACENRLYCEEGKRR